MNGKKWTAVLLTALMVFQVLASAVFGEEAGTLTLAGKLKVQGDVYVGSVLSADFSKAEPAGLTNEDVSFQWTRQEGDTLHILSEEKTYTPVQEDLNSAITLTVTGLAERGFGGSLTVKTNPVAQTAEEAAALAAQMPAEENSVPGEQYGEGYQEYPAEAPNMEYSSEENPSEDPNAQYTEGYEEYPAEDPNAQYTEGYEEYPAEDPNAQYTEGYEEYPAADPNAQYTEGYEEYPAEDPNAQYTEGETAFTESSAVSGMENVNEEVYIYDPVTGQEVTPVPETQEETPEAVGETQEVPAEQAENACRAEVTIENESQTIDFGTLSEETLADAEAQFFTVTNTGTEPLNFEGIAPEHFMVGDITETLEPGTAVSLYIVPREGVVPGEYNDEIVYRSVEGAEVSFTASMKVEETETLELSSGETETGNEEPEMTESEPEETGGEGTDPIPVGENEENTDPPAQKAELTLSLNVDPTTLDFGSLEEGYTQLPDGKPVTVTNTGTVSVKLTQPTSESFYVTEFEKTVLAPTESAEFMVWPTEGLAANEYNESISILYTAGDLPEGYDAENTTIIDESGPYTVNAAFTVTKPTKEYQLTVTPESHDFGTCTIGYKEAPEAASFTVTNKGNTAVTLNALSSASYDVSSYSAETIEPEETAVFTVRPKVGLAAGEYPETLTLSTQDADNNTLLLAAVQVKFSVKAEEKIYKIVPDRSLIDFGSAEAGYVNPPSAQTVTITNTGNTEITLSQPSAVNFSVSGLSALTLKPGATSQFTVVPKPGLSQGQYFEAITVTGDGGATASVNVSFIVSQKTIVLTGIINPADISGIRNGSEKTSAGLKLPGTVTISTNSGNMSAAVTWDVASCAYDPSLKTPQTFTINGKVTLPGGVANPNKIPLIATVRVTVNGRDPIVPDASGNQVIGIYNGDIYTTDDKISFSASGAGYGNVSPVQGDIRYVPYCWNVVENRTWDCEPYSASFRMGAAGNYVLTVTFLQQQFNGSTWVNTGVTDVRKISFTVRQGRTVTMTPIPGQVRPARTGDDNNLVLLIAALVAAGAAIAAAAVVLIRRRRK